MSASLSLQFANDDKSIGFFLCSNLNDYKLNKLHYKYNKRWATNNTWRATHTHSTLCLINVS